MLQYLREPSESSDMPTGQMRASYLTQGWAARWATSFPVRPWLEAHSYLSRACHAVNNMKH